MKSLAKRMQRYVESLQQKICTALEQVDGEASFKRDPWDREEGGGGLTAVIEDGAVFQKGGVNTSAVHGPLPETMVRALNVNEAPFFATGLSLVLHPQSPHVPTVHANFRYFALGDDLHEPDDGWFGGGADLTPYYPHLEDAQHFHAIWQSVCNAHSEVADYPDFKKQCDDYFYLPHRKETRGIGGIFYDYLRDDSEATFEFSKDAGDAFLEAYLPILGRRRSEPVDNEQRVYHRRRRGRYVEFNLIYDRGTKFGLETGGRTESILMSLPPEVRWDYDIQYPEGTPEREAEWFFTPRDWLDLSEADVNS